MIFVDDRRGASDPSPARDLHALLSLRGVPSEVQRMEFGDVAWAGLRGREAIQIGVEIKTVGDLLRCISDNRFSAVQLRGLHETYQEVYFLVEGGMKADKMGRLVLPRGIKWAPPAWGRRVWEYADVLHWLRSVEIEGGCHVHRTLSRKDTADWVAAYWSAWQKEKHHALEGFHRPGPPAGLIELGPPPTFRREVADRQPGVGWEKSAAFEAHFATAQEIANASEEELQKVPGIGKILARRIFQIWRGRA